jgi:Zn-dependent M28 family amino/carboxypeptidase
LAKAGAAAVVLVADSVAEEAFDRYGQILVRGRYAIDSASVAPRHTGQPLVILLRRSWLERARRPNQRLVASVSTESFTYASANVVATVRGTDAVRRGEYVLFSGHHDHDGIRAPSGTDSIYNGADDNGSVSVALLAIGRAAVQQPARRSLLFVWHGAEERGLLGSRWFATHPTVGTGALVAVLNGDMIGRNHPDSAALLGAVPPHRNSGQLVAMARAANAAVSHFVIDTTWDDPAHPEFWYFRSDHLPYARAGVPAVFFSTLLHPEYHTPKDEASRIDYAKLARMAQWMYATGWAAANAAERPAVDPGFHLER